MIYIHVLSICIFAHESILSSLYHVGRMGAVHHRHMRFPFNGRMGAMEIGTHPPASTNYRCRSISTGHIIVQFGCPIDAQISISIDDVLNNTENHLNLNVIDGSVQINATLMDADGCVNICISMKFSPTHSCVWFSFNNRNNIQWRFVRFTTCVCLMTPMVTAKALMPHNTPRLSTKIRIYGQKRIRNFMVFVAGMRDQ